MFLDVLVLLGLLAVIVASIYGLYRFTLHIRRRGFLFDRSASGSSGGSVFLPLQELVEPRVQHTEQVREQRLTKKDDESGSGSENPE